MTLGAENEFQKYEEELSSVDSGLKSLSAMLNTHGKGTVYFGVKADGTIRGLKIDSDALAEMQGALASRIRPGFFHTTEVCTEGSRIYLKVTASGEDGPYSFDGRYYVRNGTQDEQASNDQLRRMLLGGGADLICRIPSEQQELSFAGLLAELRAHGLDVSDSEACRRSLNLYNADNRLNQMAYLLSDQNSLLIKVVRFAGVDREVVLERTVFQNQCLLRSVKDVLNHVRSLNATMVDLSEGQRRDVPLFSYDAFREAWLNAALHCSWAEMVPPSVYVFDDRIEVASWGGMPYGLSQDGFYEGVSHPVNKALQAVFKAAGLGSPTSRGIPVIVEHCGREAFKFANGTVTVRIPFAFVPGSVIVRRRRRSTSETQQTVLQYFSIHPTATLQDVADGVRCSLSNVKKVVAQLQADGLLAREGSRRSGCWHIGWAGTERR